MQTPERQFLRTTFSSYYASARIDVPFLSSREWGFGWEKKIDVRHYAFADSTSLTTWIRKEVPLFISHSAAYYRVPDARPMEKKEWCGAELIFDFDADEIAVCPRHERGWICESCLSRARQEAKKLIDNFLIPDFGISPAHLHVNFSGKRGFHVRVTDERYLLLGRDERREIVRYLTARSFDPSTLFYEEPVGPRTTLLRGPAPEDGGLKGKCAQLFLSHLRSKTLHFLDIPPKLAEQFYTRAGAVERGILNHNWDVVPVPRKREFWVKVIQRMLVSVGEKIDEGVTLDTTKLIRCAHTLHGETGFCARAFSLDLIDAFNPLTDAVVLPSTPVRIKVTAPSITIKDHTFGPYHDEIVEVPCYAAVFFIGMGKAVLV